MAKNTNTLRESMKMTETCKTCKNEFGSGIWMSPQFRDERVLLFCSKKCKKEYIDMKLRRIKVNYPKYYEKIKSGKARFYSKTGEESNGE